MTALAEIERLGLLPEVREWEMCRGDECAACGEMLHGRCRVADAALESLAAKVLELHGVVAEAQTTIAGLRAQKDGSQRALTEAMGELAEARAEVARLGWMLDRNLHDTAWQPAYVRDALEAAYAAAHPTDPATEGKG
jgi:hypothetical protein